MGREGECRRRDQLEGLARGHRGVRGRKTDCKGGNEKPGHCVQHWGCWEELTFAANDRRDSRTSEMGRAGK